MSTFGLLEEFWIGSRFLKSTFGLIEEFWMGSTFLKSTFGLPEEFWIGSGFLMSTFGLVLDFSKAHLDCLKSSGFFRSTFGLLQEGLGFLKDFYRISWKLSAKDRGATKIQRSI